MAIFDTVITAYRSEYTSDDIEATSPKEAAALILERHDEDELPEWDSGDAEASYRIEVQVGGKVRTFAPFTVIGIHEDTGEAYIDELTAPSARGAKRRAERNDLVNRGGNKMLRVLAVVEMEGQVHDAEALGN